MVEGRLLCFHTRFPVTYNGCHVGIVHVGYRQVQTRRHRPWGRIIGFCGTEGARGGGSRYRGLGLKQTRVIDEIVFINFPHLKYTRPRPSPFTASNPSHHTEPAVLSPLPFALELPPRSCCRHILSPRLDPDTVAEILAEKSDVSLGNDGRILE